MLALPPADAQRLIKDQPIRGITLSHIGECVPEGLWIEEAGALRPLEPRGFEHRLE